VPYVDIEAGRLYYEQHGRGEDLLCIQGLSLDVSGWRAQLPAWSAHYRVTVFDNRDVGRSFYASEPYEIRALAGDTFGLADRLGLERFHLLGYSMGGAVAQEMALERPERVRSLTLCASYGGNGAWGRLRNRLAVAASARQTEAQLALELIVLTLSEQTIEQLGVEVEAMAELVLAYPHRQRREGYERQLQADASHETRDRLGRLRMPVHVIGAEQDLFVPAWKSQELADLVPGSKLSIVAGAAHAVGLERTAEYNALVLDFLREVEAAEVTGFPSDGPRTPGAL
jgi:pimeloyl-ACP methyl ester carboxylesterase